MKSFGIVSVLLTFLLAHSVATDEGWRSETETSGDIDLSKITEGLQPNFSKRNVSSPALPNPAKTKRTYPTMSDSDVVHLMDQCGWKKGDYQGVSQKN